MPRRRNEGGWNEDKLIELTALGPFVAPPRQCTRPEWCPKCRVDGFDCRSYFADEDERRAAYWAHRDDVLAMDAAYGRRPWSWWRYEAQGLCRCDPPCGPVPASGDHAGKHAWLDRHDALTGEERSALTTFRLTDVAGRLDDDA